jgi:hypothetical protein
MEEKKNEVHPFLGTAFHWLAWIMLLEEELFAEYGK